MAEIPHFTFPFNFDAYNEQDSIEDVTACVAAILSCPVGFRAEEPQFGIGDQAFRQNGADLSELRAAVTRWEPRADTSIDQVIEDATATVTARVKES
jgi:phage baseplate assembly protein W